MGDTYSFLKVRRKDFLTGKSRFVTDETGGLILNYNSDYREVVGDLDREDFLYGLVKPKDGFADGDPELSDFLKNRYDPNEEQAIVVTAKSVSGALETLRELDCKVASMPFDKGGDVGVCLKRALEFCEDKPKYVEDKPQEDGYSDEYVYYGSSRENVEIYKEVEKVYRHRAYHYAFPWVDSPWQKGASYIIEALEAVLSEMIATGGSDYVFLLAWE